MSSVKCQVSNLKGQSGYIALITILIISTIGIILGVSFAQEGIEASKTLTSAHKGAQALFNATTCAERALLRLIENPEYDGNDDFTLEQGECTIRPIISGPSGKTVETEGTVDNYVRKLVIEVATTTPEIEITSWQEVQNF